MKINLDDGFSFGLGCFETILVLDKGVWIKEHVDRMNESLKKLGIDKEITEEEVMGYISSENIRNRALKISVTQSNTVFTQRGIGYNEDIYKKGAKVKITDVKRNETSVLSGIKSLCYGDNILEKRKATEEGFQEVIFKNTKGDFSEGAVSNLFIVKEGRLITPLVESGILPGIVRAKIIEEFDVEERNIKDIENIDGMFITNSLMGVLWVSEIQGKKLKYCESYERVRTWYLEQVTKVGREILGESK